MTSASQTVRELKPGVWAPIPTFFDAEEELDVPTFTGHVVRLAQANVWPVICGSMGEAHHLTNEERVTLVKAARKALDEAGLKDIPIMAGTGTGSTKLTIQLCKEAAEAGADFAIVIASGYFAGALSKAALKKFFVDVGDASPIPVMVYNYPGAAGGIDLDSDTIIQIAQESSNICGVKLTCGAVGKLTRITAATTSADFLKKYPRKVQSAPFLTLGGFADFMLPSVLGGKAHGAIMGLANVYPYGLEKLFRSSFDLIKSSDAESLKAALELQGLASESDWAFCQVGIPGTKWFLQKTRGYGGVPRLPILPFDEKAKGEWLVDHEGAKAFMEVEKKLEAQATKSNGTNGH
ncbi:hypothetical protein QFC20_003488 [Naganishia adeliensis]|uniref:Uncharacterized protein n=1 Tax=Naganishia adeliensis TaxID=92952 RepID=A0ACC2WB82_9TREE|nr:hypothetical protein QFC20_003488 [Naganishia adeliensis]